MGRVTGRKQIGTAERVIGDLNEPTVINEAVMGNTYGPRRLNGAGWAAQGVGLAGAGGLGAYLMSGGKQTDNATDKNGVKDPSYDEDRAKVIDNYKMDKLGGASGFNTDLYQAVSKDSQWVKTAIANMGKERYMQLRKAALNDPSKGQAVHNELVKALAKSGDTEALKQAAKEPYVLPGLARTKDGVPRVVVISPQTDKKSKKTSYTALQFDWEEAEDQQ